jgi:hypothetical protein
MIVVCGSVMHLTKFVVFCLVGVSSLQFKVVNVEI